MKLINFWRDKWPYLLLILMLFLFLFLSHSRLASLSALRENLQLEEQALEREKEHLVILRQLAGEGPGFRQRLDFFEGLIPGEMAIYQQIRQLQKISALSGIRLLQVDFGDEEHAGDYVELPLELSLEGSFGAVQKMLQTMREGRQAFRVDAFDISAGQENPLLGIVLKASVFYRP